MITDSGGFQVFSLAHGGVADEIKGRGAAPPGRRGGARDRRGRRPLPLLRRRHASGSSAPRTRWRCRPRSAPTSRSPSTSARPSTPIATTRRARPSAPTAGSTAASPGTSATGPARQAVFGIVQGGVHEDLRARVGRARSRRPAVDGIAIGGTLGRDKAEMHGVLDDDRCRCCRRRRRGTCSASARSTTSRRHRRSGIDLFDCAVPTRLARHGMALAPLPAARFRLDLRKAATPCDERPARRGLPVPGLPRTRRAYLHYLVARRGADRRPPAHLHNLTYLERLVAGAREAIAAGAFAAYARRILGGAAPWARRGRGRRTGVRCMKSLIDLSICRSGHGVALISRRVVFWPASVVSRTIAATTRGEDREHEQDADALPRRLARERRRRWRRRAAAGRRRRAGARAGRVPGGGRRHAARGASRRVARSCRPASARVGASPSGGGGSSPRGRRAAPPRARRRVA